MRLLRYGPAGQEKPGMLDDEGRVRDLSGFVSDFAGSSVAPSVIDRLRRLDPQSLPLIRSPGRLGACLASVPNFYCIGLNYAQHAAEAGTTPPNEPIIFSKASSSLAGPTDPLILPIDATQTDWEVELGIIIAQEAYNITEKEALSYIAGYCTVNDISERHFQIERGGQWIKGKSAPGFGRIGPYFVTSDEITDPQMLDLELSLNGEVMQSSNTSDMIFSVAEIVAYMSRFMCLVPGDIIATGTPSGVGMGQQPPRYLRTGDVMELSVQGLGQQRIEVVAA